MSQFRDIYQQNPTIDTLQQLNKICLDESIKYIENNQVYFPKVTSNTPKSQPQMPQSPQQVQLPQAFNNQNLSQNLYKNVDLSFNQRQTEQMASPYGSIGPQMGLNFQSPMAMAGQPTTEQLLAMTIAQRRNDFPNMAVPDLPNAMGSNGQQVQQGQQGQPNLMTLLLQTRVAIQYPQFGPELMSEITQMPHLMELMNKNPMGFQQQVTNEQFLEMIINRIRDKNNPRMKRLD